MPILSNDCPRCGLTNAGFIFRGEYRSRLKQNENYGMFSCPSCDGPLLATVLSGAQYPIKNIALNVRDAAHYTVTKIEPLAVAREAPEHTPAAIAEFYVEARDSLHRGKWTSAAGMLRKCMEVALKEFAPDVDAWKLEKRIDKLAADNRITPALQEWAHELRLDGNEALHGTEPASEGLATRMERLTHFLLVYLYTLPAQVAQARADRENGN